MSEKYQLLSFETNKDLTFKYCQFDNVSYAHKALLEVPNTIIAGGSCIQYFDKYHCFNDIDVYCNNEEQVREVSYIAEYMGLKPGHPRQLGEGFVKTFSGDTTPIQIIYNKSIEGVNSVLSQFDFACCRTAVTKQNDKYFLHYDEFTENDISKKQLRFCHYRNLSKMSFERILKYYSKGYELCEERQGEFWRNLCRSITNENRPPKLAISEPVTTVTSGYIYIPAPNHNVVWKTTPNKGTK